jgi:hypothetical protein
MLAVRSGKTKGFVLEIQYKAVKRLPEAVTRRNGREVDYLVCGAGGIGGDLTRTINGKTHFSPCPAIEPGQGLR